MTARDCPGTARDCPGKRNVIYYMVRQCDLVLIAEYMYKKFFSKHLDATLLDRLFRRTSFLTHRGMLRLCGLYLSVGQLNNGKWLNIPFYFNSFSAGYFFRDKRHFD